MWRALFLSVGLTLMLLGVQSLVVEQVVIKNIRGGSAVAGQAPTNPTSPFQTASYQTNLSTLPAARPKYRLLKTREWMPWSLLAAGAIVVIYTFSLPRRSTTDEE